MALILPRSIFFDIPKTGGRIVRQVLAKTGISCFVNVTDNKHMFPDQISIDQRFSFCFVRHPLTWYESFYQFHETISTNGWQAFRLHQLCGGGSFHHFIESMMKHYPGYVSELFKLYTRVDTEQELDFIGRREYLREDLIKALQLAGEIFDPQIIMGHQDVNPSRAVEKWDKDLKAQMLQLEQFAIERFGYEEVNV